MLLCFDLPAASRVRTVAIIAGPLPRPTSTLTQPAPPIGDFAEAAASCLFHAHSDAAASARLTSPGFASCASDQWAHGDRNEHQHRKPHF